MTTNKITEGLPNAPMPLLQLGDVVLVREARARRNRVVELRGPLGPDGKQIYRVRFGRKPNQTYVELREDQLERVTAK